MQPAGVVCWQLTLCDPHLSALEVRFSRRCAIQIDVYLYLYLYIGASVARIRRIFDLVITDTNICGKTLHRVVKLCIHASRLDTYH